MSNIVKIKPAQEVKVQLAGNKVRSTFTVRQYDPDTETLKGEIRGKLRAITSADLQHSADFADIVNEILASANGKTEAKASKPKAKVERTTPCECGCGGIPAGKKSRFLPGHDMKLVSAQLAAERAK